MKRLAFILVLAVLAGSFFAAPARAQVEPVIVPISSFEAYVNYDSQNLINAFSPVGQPIVLSVSGAPANASFVDNGDGTGVFSITPDQSQVGSFKIVITAADPNNPADKSGMSVKVNVYPSTEFGRPPTSIAVAELPPPLPEAVAKVREELKKLEDPVQLAEARQEAPALYQPQALIFTTDVNFNGECPFPDRSGLALIATAAEAVLGRKIPEIKVQSNSLKGLSLAARELGLGCSYTILLPFPLQAAGQQDLQTLKLVAALRGALTEVFGQVRDFGIDFNAAIRPTAAISPNDSSYAGQWGLTKIKAGLAWNIIKEASAVPIAIVDSGLAVDHPDLKNNIWANLKEVINGRDDDGNGLVDDRSGWDFRHNDNTTYDRVGHGTHVAGVAGAVANNGLGVSGVVWQTKLVPLQVYDETDQISSQAYVSSVRPALEYILQQGIPVANLSLDTGGDNLSIKTAIKALVKSGVLVVAAAGNFKNNNDLQAAFPANYDGVITVAASGPDDQFAQHFSSYGKRNVALAAPGVQILSTVPGGNCIYCDPSGYRRLDGTSMAAPMVAGAFALAKALAPNLSADVLRTLLLETVDPVADLTKYTSTGGRLNLNKFLTRVKEAGENQVATSVSAADKKVSAKFQTKTARAGGAGQALVSLWLKIKEFFVKILNK